MHFMRTKNILIITAITGLILLVPLVAMQITPEVVWGPLDFLVMGGLIFGIGLMYELAASRGGSAVYKAAVGTGLLAMFLLIWVNLAVGLIGNEDNPGNVLYLGVIATGFIGAILAGLQPRGMMAALYAAALAQVLVPAIAWFVWGFENIIPTIGANAFFVMLFLVSGLLFQQASKEMALKRV